jgi:hypothetical protein
VSLCILLAGTWGVLTADVAQQVEQLICNQPVGGSSPLIGSFAS